MASRKTEITLLLPGLLGPQPVYPTLQQSERLTTPALELLLSRAEIRTMDETDWMTRLFEKTGFNITPGQELPIAPICAAVDGVDVQQAWWLRVDPVYVQIDRDRAMLLATEELAVKQDEADGIVAEFNRHCLEDDLTFIAAHPQRWYLRVNNQQHTDITTTPVLQVMGSNINEHLPCGKDYQYWHRLLNEMQMLLYNHDVNQQRETSGQLPINSVWLWGGGRLPAVPQPHWDRIYSDDSLVSILAQFTNIPCASLTNINCEKLAGRVLIVLPQSATWPANQDVFVWMQQLQHWEQQLFRPLLSRVRRDREIHVSLLGDDTRELSITRRGIRRWWRRRRSLEDFLSPVSA